MTRNNSSLFVVSEQSVPRRKPLTDRQRQVVELAGAYTDEEIARVIGNKKKTTKCLLRQAYDRLGVDNRFDAVRALEAEDLQRWAA